MAKIRADQALVDRGLVESRTRAQALILAGKIYTGDRRVEKAGQLLVQRVANTNVVRPPHYDLNVEVSSEGSVKIVPTLTNAPATANSSHP